MIALLRRWSWRRHLARRTAARTAATAAICRQDPEDAAICRRINDRLDDMARGLTAARCVDAALEVYADEQRQAEARRSARAARWHALSVEIALAAIHAERRGRLRSGYPLT